MPALPTKSNSAVPPSAPRFTGSAQEDFLSISQWFNAFIKAAVRDSKLLDPEFQASTGDFLETGELPDPAQTSIALAQLVANTALQKARDGFANAVGVFTVSEANNQAVLQFDTEQKDEKYAVLCQIVSETGSPASGARQVKGIAKTKTGFTVTLVAAPGVGASVTYDFFTVRNL